MRWCWRLRDCYPSCEGRPRPAPGRCHFDDADRTSCRPLSCRARRHWQRPSANRGRPRGAGWPEAFLLRANEPPKHEFSRTPSFACLSAARSASGTTLTLSSALTKSHVAGATVTSTAGSLKYYDAESPQDTCAAGRRLEFGKTSEPAVSRSGSPLRLRPLSARPPDGGGDVAASFYGTTPLVAWRPGARGRPVPGSEESTSRCRAPLGR